MTGTLQQRARRLRSHTPVFINYDGAAPWRKRDNSATNSFLPQNQAGLKWIDNGKKARQVPRPNHGQAGKRLRRYDHHDEPSVPK
jgi:hypothetical protein